MTNIPLTNNVDTRDPIGSKKWPKLDLKIIFKTYLSGNQRLPAERCPGPSILRRAHDEGNSARRCFQIDIRYAMNF